MTAQGKIVWETVERHAEKQPRSRDIIDVGAFRRLAEAGFDGRPNDVVGSFAWKRDQKKAERAAKQAAKAERTAKRAAAPVT